MILTTVPTMQGQYQKMYRLNLVIVTDVMHTLIELQIVLDSFELVTGLIVVVVLLMLMLLEKLLYL
jgi:hypothetical protein